MSRTAAAATDPISFQQTPPCLRIGLPYQAAVVDPLDVEVNILIRELPDGNRLDRPWTPFRAARRLSEKVAVPTRSVRERAMSSRAHCGRPPPKFARSLIVLPSCAFLCAFRTNVPR